MPSKSSHEKANGTSLVIIIFLLLGITFVVVGIAFRTTVGEIANLVMSSIGATLIGLSVSQFHFIRYGLPRIVDKTVSITHSLDDPVALIGYIPDNKTALRTATTTLLQRLFGRNSSPPQSLLNHIADFLDRYSKSGFCRENYMLSLTLSPIGAGPPFGETSQARREYYEASYKSEYEVRNITGEARPYRTKLRLDNHDYEGVPINNGIVIHNFVIEKVRLEDGVNIWSKNILEEIQTKCGQKLTPLVSQQATIFIDLTEDDDPKKQKILDEILTEELGPNEKLKITLQYTLYLKKQDFHLSNMSYFTQGFTMKLVAPQEVSVSFNALFTEPFESKPITSSAGLTTHTWTTKSVLHPNEGGIVWWRTRDGRATHHS